jgi:DNA end-binding protein Ku
VRLHYVRQAPSEEAYVSDEQEFEGADWQREKPSKAATPARPAPRAAGSEAAPLFHQQEPPKPMQVTRVKQTFAGGAGEEPVLRQEIMKGYEYAPEQYVVFKDEELCRLRPKTSPDMQILRSVRLPEIDPVYFETSYYVVPDRAGERPYALLYAALQKTEYVALAKVAMHGREHIIVLRPAARGIVAHTMYYRDEIRAENEYPANMSAVAARELELATTFVEAIAGPFAPEEFKDTYREEVESLISGKIGRKEVAASSPPKAPAATPVADMIDTLKRSIELAKTTAKTSAQVPRRTPAKVTEIKPRSQRRKA